VLHAIAPTFLLPNSPACLAVHTNNVHYTMTYYYCRSYTQAGVKNKLAEGASSSIRSQRNARYAPSNVARHFGYSRRTFSKSGPWLQYSTQFPSSPCLCSFPGCVSTESPSQSQSQSHRQRQGQWHRCRGPGRTMTVPWAIGCSRPMSADIGNPSPFAEITVCVHSS
jgi:hypothetical protein